MFVLGLLHVIIKFFLPVNLCMKHADPWAPFVHFDNYHQHYETNQYYDSFHMSVEHVLLHRILLLVKAFDIDIWINAPTPNRAQHILSTSPFMLNGDWAQMNSMAERMYKNIDTPMRKFGSIIQWTSIDDSKWLKHLEVVWFNPISNVSSPSRTSTVAKKMII